MEIAKENWPILQKLDDEFATIVQSFLVTNRNGLRLFVVTNDGQGYWFSELNKDVKKFGTANWLSSLGISDLVSMAQGDSNVVLLNKQGEIFMMSVNKRGDFFLMDVNKRGITFMIDGNKWRQIFMMDVNKRRHIPNPFRKKSRVYFSSSPSITCDVHSFNSKFTSIRCGSKHTLALTEDGQVWAFGMNDSGQIGRSTNHSSSSFVSLITELVPHRIVAVECGSRHCLALTDQGEVYAWGGNDFGQLGHCEGDYNSIMEKGSHTPTQISTPGLVKSMAAGFRHTLLLTRDGQVYACGSNRYGQLGHPTDIKCSTSLVKVAGLPSISQIASHYSSKLSMAMTSDRTCYVWGQIGKERSSYIPIKLSPKYHTFDSVLALYGYKPGVSVIIENYDTSKISMANQMSSMFDNPEASDVQFVVEQRTIHAHRTILTNSSDYFSRMFSEIWLASVDPIVQVSIADYSYVAFHAYLQYLYTNSCPTEPSILVELFELAGRYLELDLQQFCLFSMSTTLSLDTFCLYYPLVHLHSLPQISAFKQELVQFAATNMAKIVDIDAYKSMEAELRDNLTISIANFEQIKDKIVLPIHIAYGEMFDVISNQIEQFNLEED